jgi:hypothetical protein
MSPIGTPVPGAFPLTSVARLPNVTVGYPGERWSDRKASGAIDPGCAVVPMNVAGKNVMRAASGGDATTQVAVASRTIDVPDTNPGSIYVEALGPNEIKNLPIQEGDYILALYSGVLHMTLVTPDATYGFGDLIGWIPGAPRPTGKPAPASTACAGSWGKQAKATEEGRSWVGPLFEVTLWRPVNAAGTEGILTCRSLRGQGPF